MWQILGEDTSPQQFLAPGVFSSKPQVWQSLPSCGKMCIPLDSSWRWAGFSTLQLQHGLKSAWFLTTHQRKTSAAKKKLRRTSPPNTASRAHSVTGTAENTQPTVYPSPNILGPVRRTDIPQALHQQSTGWAPRARGQWFNWASMLWSSKEVGQK